VLPTDGGLAGCDKGVKDNYPLGAHFEDFLPCSLKAGKRSAEIVG